jgi:hypothetical protein
MVRVPMKVKQIEARLEYRVIEEIKNMAGSDVDGAILQTTK